MEYRKYVIEIQNRQLYTIPGINSNREYVYAYYTFTYCTLNSLSLGMATDLKYDILPMNRFSTLVSYHGGTQFRSKLVRWTD